MLFFLQEPIPEANATPQTTEPATQPASAVAPPTPAAPPAGQPEKSVVESSVPAQVKTADVPSSPSAGKTYRENWIVLWFKYYISYCGRCFFGNSCFRF